MTMIVNTDGKLPIKAWVKSQDNIEETALAQAINLANMPYTFSHVALMPDVHMGYGMPIGGVLATDGVVVPNAVGSDIGCGMIAQDFNIPVPSRQVLEYIVELIYKRIPVGFSKHLSPVDTQAMPTRTGSLVVSAEFDNASRQMGTLGSGNHFIELQRDEEDHLWVMIHSGSRNIGKKVSDYYILQAKNLCSEWHHHEAVQADLAFIPTSHDLAIAYLNDMYYCLEFALFNRLMMMNVVEDIIREVLGLKDEFDLYTMPINDHHNYANLEYHFGKNVWVHRKGATSALNGQLGIIPGSQGTPSYIVRGKGNPLSFMSCSHGAGRRMGRKVAKKVLDFEGEKARLDKQDIVHRMLTRDDLDEASGAYKDIDSVMENQTDLVDILYKLSPVAVVKG